VGVQEIRWDKGGTEPASEYTFFYRKGNNNHELGRVFLYYGYSKSSIGELLTKQAMGKRVLHIKNTYMLKLIINLLTDETEAIVSGNKFLYS
jgi:hypothetical protein